MAAGKYNRTDQVRAILSEPGNEDGLNAISLALVMRMRHGWMGSGLKDLRPIIARMPDVYLDRWIVPKRRGAMIPVFLKVAVPADAPKPTRNTTAETRLTAQKGTP
jgi:hypothetical protein